MEKLFSSNSAGTISRLWELCLVIILLALVSFLHLYRLDADPPDKISFSQGINTDPPAYTLFARHAVLHGDWNPLNDNRFPTHQYSLISGLAYLVFLICGVSAWSTNFVAVILSLAGCVLFYFIVRRAGGPGTALIALLFYGTTYLAIFFGRRPFLEVGMNFLFLAGLFCLTYLEEKNSGHFLFGLLLGASIVFGKLIGLAFLAVPVVYYFFKIFVEKKRDFKIKALFWAAGLLVLTATWYGLIFVPNMSEIAGYVGEQAFGAHSVPQSTESISKLIWKFFVFGQRSDFFNRLPVLILSSIGALLIFAGRYFSPTEKRNTGGHDAVWLALVAWFVGAYLFQMPWNYQPVRYQTTLIFPLSALTAYLIVYLGSSARKIRIFNSSPVFNLILLVVSLITVYQLTATIIVQRGGQFTFVTHFHYILLAVVPVIALYFILARLKKSWSFYLPRIAGLVLGLCLIVYHLGGQGALYYNWAQTPLYTARDNSRDLQTILSPGAVITGPYAPALAVENDILCMTNTFGSVKADSILLTDFPITHLLVDRTNIEDLKADFPALKGHLVWKYYVNNRNITLFRISGTSGHKDVSRYFLSSFEMATMNYAAGQSDSGSFFLARHLKLNPENLSGHASAALQNMVDHNYDGVIDNLKQAMVFSPTDFNLHFLMGIALKSKGEAESNPALLAEAEKEFDSAKRYNLGYNDFDDLLEKGIIGGNNEFNR